MVRALRPTSFWYLVDSHRMDIGETMGHGAQPGAPPPRLGCHASRALGRRVVPCVGPLGLVDALSIAPHRRCEKRENEKDDVA
jgi:hypothetical protein